MNRSDTRTALGTGALAGAACAACCAPPLIAALGITVGLAIAGCTTRLEAYAGLGHDALGQ